MCRFPNNILLKIKLSVQLSHRSWMKCKINCMEVAELKLFLDASEILNFHSNTSLSQMTFEKIQVTNNFLKNFWVIWLKKKRCTLAAWFDSHASPITHKSTTKSSSSFSSKVWTFHSWKINYCRPKLSIMFHSMPYRKRHFDTNGSRLTTTKLYSRSELWRGGYRLYIGLAYAKLKATSKDEEIESRGSFWIAKLSLN